MTKKIVLVLFVFLLLLTGCTNNKFSLEDKYYQKGEYIEINYKDYNKIKDESFVLFTYNNYCQFSVPCDEVFLSVMKKNNISFLKMPYAEFKKTDLHEKVKYAPSVIIVKKGKIIAYLDSASDSDVDLYQDTEKFENWLKKYINIK